MKCKVQLDLKNIDDDLAASEIESIVTAWIESAWRDIRENRGEDVHAVLANVTVTEINGRDMTDYVR
jgi:hypothetical protein